MASWELILCVQEACALWKWNSKTDPKIPTPRCLCPVWSHSLECGWGFLIRRDNHSCHYILAEVRKILLLTLKKTAALRDQVTRAWGLSLGADRDPCQQLAQTWDLSPTTTGYWILPTLWMNLEEDPELQPRATAWLTSWFQSCEILSRDPGIAMPESVK